MFLITVSSCDIHILWGFIGLVLHVLFLHFFDCIIHVKINYALALGVTRVFQYCVNSFQKKKEFDRRFDRENCLRLQIVHLHDAAHWLAPDTLVIDRNSTVKLSRY